MRPGRASLSSRHTLLFSCPARRAVASRTVHKAVRCEQQGQQEPVRRLILMRHADSQVAGKTRDHDRPILPQGAAAAQQVARQLKERGWIPEVVICSNALRTRQTFEAMREEVPELEDVDSHFHGSLYTVAALDGQTRAHLQELLAAEAGSSHSCILCMGHDRGWSEAATSFTGRVVGLGNSHAALMEGRGATWAEALSAETLWELVDILVPQGETPRLGPELAAS